MLDKIQVLDKPVMEQERMRIQLEPRTISGNDVLAVEGLTKSFPDKNFSQNSLLRSSEEKESLSSAAMAPERPRY